MAHEGIRGDAAPIRSPGIIGRWRLYGRLGDHAGDQVVMTRDAWASLPDGARPDGGLDVTGTLVVLDVPAGWPGGGSR